MQWSGPSVPDNFVALYLRPYGMTRSNRIVHDDQTSYEETFCRVDIPVRADNGSVGHGSRVKWVNKFEWVTWVGLGSAPVTR